MNEIWRDISGFEGLYKINSVGDIKSLPRNGTIKSERLLKQKIDKDGYRCVVLHKNNIRHDYHVHRLVATTFINNDNDLPQVNHIDGDKSNNNVNNLEWCTGKENVQHAWRTGLQKRRYGENNDKSIAVAQYTLDDELLKVWGSLREIERETNYKRKIVSECCKHKRSNAYGYNWKYYKRCDVNG